MSYQEILNSTNLSTFQQILQQANINSSGMFWTFIYWMILFISMIILSSYGIEVSLLISLFIGMIIGLFLLVGGLINSITYAATEALLLFLIILIIYTSNKHQ